MARLHELHVIHACISHGGARHSRREQHGYGDEDREELTNAHLDLI